MLIDSELTFAIQTTSSSAPSQPTASDEIQLITSRRLDFIIAGAGDGGAIVMYIANFFGFMTIVVSLAEMASM